MDKPTVQQSLVALRDLTNRVLDSIKPRHKKTIGGAVNWGSLDCYEARWWMDSEGRTGYTVYVQEATHDASGLQRWIRDQLANAGWPAVEVVTEW